MSFCGSRELDLEAIKARVDELGLTAVTLGQRLGRRPISPGSLYPRARAPRAYALALALETTLEAVLK